MTSGQTSSRGGLWKQLIGIGIALLFLWLAFRGIDMELFLGHLRRIQPLFILVLCMSALASHFLRAWRWLILLKPVRERRVSLWNSFCAVMIGYAVNVVIPRGGEIARLVSISRSEKLPWVGVLPTMFIDRLIDIALLMLLLGFTLVVFPSSATADLPWLVPSGISLSIATVAGLVMLPRMSDIINWCTGREWIKKHVSAGILQSVEKLSKQFHAGTQSLSSPGAYPAIALLSLGIWFFYWLNFYLMIWALALQNQVSVAQCLVVFTIGSVGVLVPTPGNVGSFHFLVSQGLVIVAGVNRELALAFATVLHILCFVIVTCIPAAICVAIQSAARGGQASAGEQEKGQAPQPEEVL